MASEPITRMPDDMPTAKDCAGMNPVAASSKPVQPITVSRLPTTMSTLYTCRADLTARDAPTSWLRPAGGYFGRSTASIT